MSNGSKWWKIDFHTHTPASDDFKDASITPEDWLKAAMDNGLDAVVVTDHNSGLYIDRLRNALLKLSQTPPEWYRSLTVFPGVEVAVAGNGERVHILGVFDPNMDSASITGVLGKCGICSGYGDHENTFSEMGVIEVVKHIHDLGGVAIPAHVDAEKGVLHGRDSLTPELKRLLDDVAAIQVVSNIVMRDKGDGRIVDRVAHVCGSDAHALAEIGSKFSWIKMGRPSISSLRLALHDHGFCVRPWSDVDPNCAPDFYVQRLIVSRLRCCGRGADGSLTIEFSPHLTSLIGGRGTGKSTMLECLRYAFRQAPDAAVLPQLSECLEKFSRDMFLDESAISVEFFFHGINYRVNWSSSGEGQVLEQFVPTDNKWSPVDHGDIALRFPISVFSQKQLFEIAKDPRGLLAFIDRTEAVNRDEWNRRWEQKKSEYLQLCVRARELRNRRNAAESLAIQIADLDRKIAEYQKRGYGDVLRKLALFNRQYRVLNVEGVVKEIAIDIRNHVEKLVVPDIQDNLFPMGDACCDQIRSVYSTLSEKISSAYKSIVDAIDGVFSAIVDYRRSIEECSWMEQKKACDTAFAEMSKSIKAAGDEFDPNLYGRWIAERSQLAAEYAKLEGIKHDLKIVLDGIKNTLSGLVLLRNELCQKRADFLQSVLSNNKYVRITVVPFADMSTLERDIRGILGIDGERYAASIYSGEDKSGLLSELINWREQNVSPKRLLDMIDNMKKCLWKGAHGEPTGLNAAFNNRLKAIYESTPTVFNELSAYWPEDLLEVKYVVGNDKPKALERGSAGQKAAAILSFLLGYGTAPLVLDQPEDDLDNALIVDLVVKQLHVNKQRRQLIVATHNPNIVVNGDSEQVCVMKFAGGLIGTLCQSSLDDLAIRRSVCKIMEGGEDAFKKRYERMLGGMEYV